MNLSPFRLRLLGSLFFALTLSTYGCGDAGSDGAGGSGSGTGTGTSTGTGQGGDAATTGTGTGTGTGTSTGQGGGGTGGGGIGPAAAGMMDWSFDGSLHSVAGTLTVQKQAASLQAQIGGTDTDPPGTISIFFAITAPSGVVTFSPGTYACAAASTPPSVEANFVEDAVFATSANTAFDCELTIEEEFGLVPDQSGPTGTAIGYLSGTVSDGTTTYPVEAAFNLTQE